MKCPECGSEINVYIQSINGEDTEIKECSNEKCSYMRIGGEEW